MLVEDFIHLVGNITEDRLENKRYFVVRAIFFSLLLCACSEGGTGELFKEASLVSRMAYFLPSGNKAILTNIRSIELDDFGSSVMTWTASDQQGVMVGYFGLIESGLPASPIIKQADYNINLRHGAFDPLKRCKFNESVAEEHRAALYIVQFVSEPYPAYLAALRALKVEVISYVPNYAYIVRMDSHVRARLAALPFVRWIDDLDPSLKHPPTLSVLSVDEEKKTRFDIMPVRRDEAPQLAYLLRDLGAENISYFSDGIIIEADLSAAQVNEVVRSHLVVWLEASPTHIVEHTHSARQMGGADILAGLEFNLTGKGIIGHVLEGINPRHKDFAANAYRKEPIGIDNTNASMHGHATYGIIFGSGMGNHQTRGILPDGQGLYTNNSAIYRGTSGEKVGGTRYELVGRLIGSFNAMFQSASWGYAATSEYTLRSAEMDAIIFDHDIPIIQSHGNHGSALASPQSWAKNIISVGGVQHFSTLEAADHRWGGKASTGPANDGRIKPDLVGFNDGVFTTSLSGGYQGFFGTSAAAPIVAGYAGLVIDMWTSGVFSANPVRSCGDDASSKFDARPRFTTTKALLINSAFSYAFRSKSDDLSRMHQGWGFPDLGSLYKKRNSLIIINEDVKLIHNRKYTKKIQIADGLPEFKVTMVYRDPPAALISGKTLVNDLNLKVTAPSGEVYWGNYGLSDGNYSVSGGTPNDLDTVENVFIANPSAGEWLVEVIAEEINQDGCLESRELDVDFALVIDWSI